MKAVVKGSFKLNLTVMSLLGLYPPATYPRFYKICSYTLYTVSMVPAVFLGLTLLFLEENTNRAFDEITTSVIFMSPKILSVLMNSENIKRCVVYFDNEIYASQYLHYVKIINSCVRICRRNSNIFFFGCVAAIIIWCSTLLVSDHKNLPFAVWLPFADRTTLYNCLYFDLILAFFYSGLACATVDPLIAGLISHAAGQVQVVKANLEHLGKDLATNSIIKSGLVYHKIAKCVDHYNAIARFIEDYERCFSAAIFYQFTHSVITICVFCLQISKSDQLDLNFLVKAACLVLALIQVYFYCYYGTTLIEENHTVAEAIYMSNWYEYDKQSKKALLVFMERSRRPLVLTAGKILDVSLETFTLILRRSYSLLAVLKNY